MRTFKGRLIFYFLLLTFMGALVSGVFIYSSYMKFIDESVEVRLSAIVYAIENAYDYSGVNDLWESGSFESDYFKDGNSVLYNLNEKLGTAYSYVLIKGDDGKFYFSFDSDTYGKADSADSTFLTEYEDCPSVVLAWETKKIAIDTDYYTDDWGTFRSASLPLINENGEVYAVIASDLKATEIEALKRGTLFTLMISVLMALGVAVVLALIFASRIVRPILFTSNALADIAGGNGDLSRRIDFSSSDEIGQMAGNYNNFLDKMSGMIRNILEAEKELTGTGEELAANMVETSSAVTEISANIVHIKKQVSEQSLSVGNSRDAVKAILDGVRLMDLAIVEQARGVSESSAAIEQMMANIRGVSDNQKNSESLFGELKSASENGKDRIEVVGSRVMDIAGQSESLQEANSIIAGIASMTNLLAMNAAIEAAHAGEAGKGFSVVADEIRKLAEQSSNQSKSIGTTLQTVLGSITQVVDATKTTEQAFEAVMELINQLQPLSTQITGAMEEQNAGVSQIIGTLDTLNNISTELQEKSSDMNSKGELLNNQMATLSRISSEVDMGMTEIEKGTEEISRATSVAAEYAESNKDKITMLSVETALFKLND